MRTAIVGVGDWGKNILRNLDDLSNLCVCCFSGSAETEEFLDENHPDIEKTTEVERVINDDSIDAVFVATPPETHFEIARKVIESGKDVFIEKPMTTDVEDSRRLVNLAEQNNQLISVGYIFLHNPVYERLESIVDSEGIESLNFDWRKCGSFSDHILSTLTCHDVAIAHDLSSSSYEEASAKVCLETKEIDILETDIEFQKFSAKGTYNRMHPSKQKSVTLKTEEGNIYVWRKDNLYEFDRKNLRFEKIFESEEEPLKLEISSFLKNVKERTIPRSNGKLGRDIDVILQKMKDKIE